MLTSTNIQDYVLSTSTLEPIPYDLNDFNSVSINGKNAVTS